MGNIKTEYLIVGYGIAGFVFYRQLLKQGKKAMVISNTTISSSSKVSGGMYNPIALKRVLPSWRMEECDREFHDFYNDYSNFVDSYPLLRKVSPNQINEWNSQRTKHHLEDYLEEITDSSEKDIWAKVSGVGRVHVHAMLNDFEKEVTNEMFDFSLLDMSPKTYRNISFDKLVFCEGTELKNNPYFNYLPLVGTKGQVIKIKLPESFVPDKIYSGKGIFVAPDENNSWFVGSTFEWNDKTLLITEKSKQWLLDRVSSLLELEVNQIEVVDQKAGIRPTVKDRRPLVGKHPKFDDLYLLNGLGTRGVYIAPLMAKELISHIENKAPIHPEASIERYAKFYTEE